MSTILYAFLKASLLWNLTTQLVAALGTPQGKPAACVGSGKGASCSLPDLAPHMNALYQRKSPFQLLHYLEVGQVKVAACMGSKKGASCSLHDLASHMNVSAYSNNQLKNVLEVGPR